MHPHAPIAAPNGNNQQSATPISPSTSAPAAAISAIPAFFAHVIALASRVALVSAVATHVHILCLLRRRLERIRPFPQPWLGPHQIGFIAATFWAEHTYASRDSEPVRSACLDNRTSASDAWQAMSCAHTGTLVPIALSSPDSQTRPRNHSIIIFHDILLRTDDKKSTIVIFFKPSRDQILINQSYRTKCTHNLLMVYPIHSAR